MDESMIDVGAPTPVDDAATAALRHQMAALVEAADDAILTKTLDGIVRSCNPAVKSLLGYDATELVGRPVTLLIPDERQAEEAMILEQIRSGRRVAHFDTVRRRKDGSLVEVSLTISPIRSGDGTVIGASKIMRDVTERRRATEHFRLALEAAPTGMMVLDTDGVITFVNTQVERLFGYPRADLLGRPIEMLVPERFREHHPGLRTAFCGAPQARPMGAGRALYGRRQDGSEFPVEIGLNPLRTPAGTFIVSSIVDISLRHEVDLLRADFISTVSHELRTPLTSITAALALLDSGRLGTLPDKVAAMIRIATTNGVRLARIVDDILDFGRLENGQVALTMVRLALRPLVEDSIEANAPYAHQYGVRLVLDPGDDDAWVCADPDRLMQVIANLLTNAAKVSPSGAEVQVRIRGLGPVVRVDVEDRGSGVPAAFQSRIFERFAQADASAARRIGGTGLGLSIARKLARTMGGDVGFTTVIDSGSIFYVELPATTAPGVATPG